MSLKSVKNAHCSSWYGGDSETSAEIMCHIDQLNAGKIQGKTQQNWPTDPHGVWQYVLYSHLRTTNRPQQHFALLTTTTTTTIYVLFARSVRWDRVILAVNCPSYALGHRIDLAVTCILLQYSQPFLLSFIVIEVYDGWWVHIQMKVRFWRAAVIECSSISLLRASNTNWGIYVVSTEVIGVLSSCQLHSIFIISLAWLRRLDLFGSFSARTHAICMLFVLSDTLRISPPAMPTTVLTNLYIDRLCEFCRVNQSQSESCRTDWKQ